VEVDVAAFERALSVAAGADRQADPDSAREALQQAAALYRGDLLPGCYDEWLEPDRERLRQAYRSTLMRLVRLLEAQRNYPLAIPHAERLLQMDSLDEEACAALMRLHALNNDRAAALRVYRECEAALRQELGAGPGLAVREAHERLLGQEAAQSADAGPWRATWPLVNRQSEWEQLLAAWRAAARGQAGMVLVAGEAGIGKSRLAEELLGWASQQGFATARTRAYAAEGRLAYGPVADWLRSQVVGAGLGRLPAPWISEAARLLPELLVGRPDVTPPEPLSEYWQRQRFFDTLARIVLGASQPLLLLFDDLQWCDPETLEWLHYLLRFDAKARLLLVGTARAEDIGPPHPLHSLLLDLRARACLTTLTLRPLDAAETFQLAGHALGRRLAPEAAQALFHETEGNPLFVVETLRARLATSALAPAGADAPERPALPPRVHSIIATRLGQLSPSAGEIAGLAATIGRAFRQEVLARAAGVDEADLARGLDELWQRRIIREHGAGLYDFSHDKLREVAYAEVSPPLRRLLHRRVAQALETAHAPDTSAVSGQIAAHYEQAGLAALAVPYYLRAAEVAQRVFANEEAISLLHRALALLNTQPENAQRQAMELAAQTALGAALVASRGYDTGEVLEAYGRALALCQVHGLPPNPPILRGLAIAAIGRGNLLQAKALGEQLQALADQSDDAMLAVEAHYLRGVASFWQGDFVASRRLLEQALARYQPRRAQAHLAQYSQDPKAICLVRLAMGLWWLGELAPALEAAARALAQAQALAHPLSLGYVYVWLAVLHQHRGDAALTREWAEAVLDLDRASGVPYWVPFAHVLRGWARHRQAEPEAGWAEVQAGLEALRAAERELLKPYFLGLRAELLARDRRPSEGLLLLDEALALVAAKHEHWCEAELLRLQGELRAAAGQPGSTAALEHSLDVARTQQARSLELRSAVSLARLWLAQGRPGDARRALDSPAAWFASGPGFPDLAEARALLSRL
jgi:predicted ATPase